jgi:hypothetical protein
MPDRPRSCPWFNYPTHRKNRKLQVDGYRPIVYGYCPQTEDCGSCAGTTYKPNILLQQGREHEFVPCPYCLPEEYRRRVERLKDKLPK